MDFKEFRNKFIRENLEIEEDYGKILSFIDFANINNWFVEDTQDWNNQLLSENEFLEIDLEKLKNFSDIFSERTRIYYGEDPKNKKSLGFTYLLRKVFGKRNVVTKDLQKIKHYITREVEQDELKFVSTDKDGEDYIEIRKCNFDVEISVDAIKMIEHYDTFCIFSSDADFVYLNNYLRRKGKRVIIVKAGYITTKLRKSADLIINAQKIKKYITRINKQRPD